MEGFGSFRGSLRHGGGGGSGDGTHDERHVRISSFADSQREERHCCEHSVYSVLDRRKWRYSRLLLLSISLQLANVAVVYAGMPQGVRPWDAVPPGVKLGTVLIQLLQVSAMGVGILVMARIVWVGRVSLGKAWQAYLTVLLSYAGIYFALFLFAHRPQCPHAAFSPHEAFATTVPDLTLFAQREGTAPITQRAALAADPLSLFIALLYFATATQSSVGFGDIVPNSFAAQFIVASQQAFGLIYNVVVIAQVESLYGAGGDDRLRELAASEAAVVASEAARRRGYEGAAEAEAAPAAAAEAESDVFVLVHLRLMRPRQRRVLQRFAARVARRFRLHSSGTIRESAEWSWREQQSAAGAHSVDGERGGVVSGGAAGATGAAGAAGGWAAWGASAVAAAAEAEEEAEAEEAEAAAREGRPKSHMKLSDALGATDPQLHPQLYPQPPPQLRPHRRAASAAAVAAGAAARKGGRSAHHSSASQAGLTLAGMRRNYSRMKHNQRVQRIRRFVRRWLLPLSLAVQLSNFLVIYLLDPSSVTSTEKDLDGKGQRKVQPLQAAISTLVQVVQMVAVVATSFKYVQRRHSSGASASFLLQSFLAVTCSFACIYATMYLFVHVQKRPFTVDLNKELHMPEHCRRRGENSGAGAGSWDNATSMTLWLSNEPFQLVTLSSTEDPSIATGALNLTLGVTIERLLYFSFTVMTTTGYGDVFATQWYSRVLVTLHMWIGVVYSSVILGFGMSKIKRQRNENTAQQQRLSALRQTSTGVLGGEGVLGSVGEC
jgi:hypothetical protein